MVVLVAVAPLARVLVAPPAVTSLAARPVRLRLRGPVTLAPPVVVAWPALAATVPIRVMPLSESFACLANGLVSGTTPLAAAPATTGAFVTAA